MKNCWVLLLFLFNTSSIVPGDIEELVRDSRPGVDVGFIIFARYLEMRLHQNLMIADISMPSINRQNNITGRTFLHHLFNYALHSNARNDIRKLLLVGADSTIRDHEQLTPFDSFERRVLWYKQLFSNKIMYIMQLNETHPILQRWGRRDDISPLAAANRCIRENQEQANDLEERFQKAVIELNKMERGDFTQEDAEDPEHWFTLNGLRPIEGDWSGIDELPL